MTSALLTAKLTSTSSPARSRHLRQQSRGATADLPVFAICGRPNVGKSTLFNRLTGSRRSIVGDEPGITRDRIYGEVEWAGRTARIVDTGGIIPDDADLIPAEIFRQARTAFEEAEAIVMVVDGRTELAAPDIELARLLIRCGKPIFLAVNKIDTDHLAAAGRKLPPPRRAGALPVSAEHGSGIGDLLEAVFDTPANFPEQDQEEISAAAADDRTTESHHRTHGEYEQRETTIAIIGRPNVGKSTLLNALTGTSRAIVSPIAGTTRDAVDEVVEHNGAQLPLRRHRRHSPQGQDPHDGRKALRHHGPQASRSRRRRHCSSSMRPKASPPPTPTSAATRTRAAAPSSSSSTNGTSSPLRAPMENRRPTETSSSSRSVDVLKYLDYAPIVFLSAAHGTNLHRLYEAITLVATERRKRVTTGQMNRFLEHVDFQRATVPASKHVRIYYMTQAAVAPPTFVLFTDREVRLHFSYERFLENQIRDAFGFVGSPIWFKVRARNAAKADRH